MGQSVCLALHLMLSRPCMGERHDKAGFADEETDIPAEGDHDRGFTAMLQGIFIAYRRASAT